MSASQLYATSTIAISAYNILARLGAEMSAKQIHEELVQTQHPGLKMGQLRTALRKLAQLYLISASNGVFKTRDPRRRVITHRDKSDACIDAKTGEVKGGWNGWMLQDAEKGNVSVFEVAR